jgi:hypothetical protein
MQQMAQRRRGMGSITYGAWRRSAAECYGRQESAQENLRPCEY